MSYVFSLRGVKKNFSCLLTNFKPSRGKFSHKELNIHSSQKMKVHVGNRTKLLTEKLCLKRCGKEFKDRDWKD